MADPKGDEKSYRITKILEDIRNRSNAERMEFIKQRMSVLREDNASTTLITAIKNKIRENEEEKLIRYADHLGSGSNLKNNELNNTNYKDEGDKEIKYAERLSNITNLKNNELLELIRTRGKPLHLLAAKEKDWKEKKDNPSIDKLMERETTWMFLGDRHSAIRNFMRERGWTEKFGTFEEQSMMRRVLGSSGRNQMEEPAKFIWLNGWINWSTVSPRVVVSRIPSNLPFTKTNLSLGIKNTLPFSYEKGEVLVRTPRTFEVRGEADMKDFLRHYRLSACICLLKKFLSTPSDQLFSSEGMVPLECIEFSIKRINELLKFIEHEDLDEWNFSVVRDTDWENFLLRFYDISLYNAKFLFNPDYDLMKMQATCKKLLEAVDKAFPEMRYEGTKNLWISKPSNGSCGRGVKVFKKYSEIVNNMKPDNAQVIQKYIEEPLLIYNTKFDIRQWFVITSVSPLIIWMYDEFYLRFCSQEFSLNTLHESVHLCNNTIQWKYKNGVRNPKLPSENMWDCYEFHEFLRNELKQDQYAHIKEQMKQSLTAACIAAQEKMYHRANSFQLYGADFMLTPDFTVWLIEINTQPAMKYSTSVTARMCKAVLEDTIKVGLLRRSDPSVNVGKFTQIYRQKSDRPRNFILPMGGLAHTRKSTMLPNSYHNTTFDLISKTAKRPAWLTSDLMAIHKYPPKVVNIQIGHLGEVPMQPGDSTDRVEEKMVLNDLILLQDKNEKTSNKTKISIKKENERRGLKTLAVKANETKKSPKNSKTSTETFKASVKITKIVSKEKIRVPSGKPKNPEPLAEKKQNTKTESKIIYKEETTNKKVPATPKRKEKKKVQTVLIKDGAEVTNTKTTKKRSNVIKEYEDKETIKSPEVLSLLEKEPEEKYENVNTFSSNVYYLFEEVPDTRDSSDMSKTSSLNDVFTHKIIKGEEILPELSGYAFIGETANDRKIEYILNSTEFLRTIGKEDTKAPPPMFKDFINRYECCE